MEVLGNLASAVYFYKTWADEVSADRQYLSKSEMFWST